MSDSLKCYISVYPVLYQCAFFPGFCTEPNNNDGETLGQSPEAETRPEPEDPRTAAAASAASADTSATSERKSSSEGSEHNNEQRDIFNDNGLSDHDGDHEDTSLQCDHCSDKFMSETSMRIHAVRCNRSRQQSELPDNEVQRVEDIRR